MLPAPHSASQLRELPENRQRLLVLRAAREASKSVYDELRNRQPTLRELDNEFSGLLCTGLFFLLIPFVGIPVLVFAAQYWRVRAHLHRNWRAWLEEWDPEAEALVLHGDIRRLVAKLPWRTRWQLRALGRELKRLTRHSADLHRRLETLRGAVRAAPRAGLQQKRDRLAAALSAEADALVGESLRRQLEAVEGQLAARSALLAWVRRLRAARDECHATLEHLHDRLALQLAGGPSGLPLARTEDAAAGLRSLNDRLAATQAASEEVLQATRG